MSGSKRFLVRIPPAVLLLLCVVFVSHRAFAQKPGTAEGYWKGTVNIPEGTAEVLIWINRNPEGVWGGTLGVPAEGTKDIPLVVTVEGKSTTFRFPGGPGSNGFKGTLSADANKITGSFMKEGSPFPFELTRQPGPPPATPAVVPSPSPNPENAVAHARRVLGLMRQEKFADVAKEFDAQFAALMPVAKLGETWSMLRTKSGQYKSELSQNVQQLGTATMVTLGCQFEREAMNMMVIFGPGEKISGLQFVPRIGTGAAPRTQPAQPTPKR